MAGSYVVRTGDTLRSIAQSHWGDGEMWWMLAQSNNLDESDSLTAGQVLTVPNKVTNIHNNANTFRPYNPGEVIGHIDPTLPSPPPPPQADGGCGGIGLVIMIVVAVVVTIYTAGAFAAAAGSSFGATMGAGASVLSGGTLISGSVAATMGAAAVAGAAGSIASQAVGMATGNVKSFSFKQVALSALGAGVTAGVGAGLNSAGVLGSTAAGAPALTTSQAVGRAIITGAAASAATQIAQGRWSWREIAASAVGGAAGAATGSALGQAASPMGQIATGVTAGMAGGLASEAVRRTDPGYQRGDLTNMFLSSVGSAIGNMVGRSFENSETPPTPTYLQRRAIQLLFETDAPLDYTLSGSIFTKDSTAQSNTDINVPPGADRKLVAQLASRYQQQYGVTAQEAQRQASAVIEQIGVDGLDGVFDAGGKAKADWKPSSKAQQSAFDAVIAQGHDAETASEVARIVATKERVAFLSDDLDALRLTNPALARQVEQFMPVFNDALLSRDVYFNTSIAELMPKGYARLTAGELGTVGLTSGDLRDDDSGYSAAVYRTDKGGYVFANRGTEFTNGLPDFKDWWANMQQGSGQGSEQYDKAIKAAQKITSVVHENVEFTGHSLGGGLAMAQALVTGSHATVFNAAGVHVNTIEPYGRSFARAAELVSAYNVNGEILNFTQDSGKYSLALVVTTLGGLGGIAGSLLGGAAADKLLEMPAVQGQRFALDAVQPPTQTAAGVQWGVPMTPTQTLTNSLSLHYASSMIDALAARLYSGRWSR